MIGGVFNADKTGSPRETFGRIMRAFSAAPDQILRILWLRPEAALNLLLFVSAE